MTRRIGAPRKAASVGARRRDIAVSTDPTALLADLRGLIQSARQRIASVAYSTQTLLCWHLGRRLLTGNLHGRRAAFPVPGRWEGDLIGGSRNSYVATRTPLSLRDAD